MSEVATDPKASYHADYDALSATMLKQFYFDRSVFYDRYVARTQPPMQETRAMEMGSILHQVLLDGDPVRSVVGVYPDRNEEWSEIRELTGPKRDKLPEDKVKRFAEICGVSPEEFKNAKGGKELKAITSKAPDNVIDRRGAINSSAASEFRAAHPEYRYFVKRSGGDLTTPCYESIRAAVTSIRSSQYYRLLESEQVVKETPIYWQCRFTGRQMRCCPDFLLVDPKARRAFTWDLKISDRVLDFERQMHSLAYWIQQCHYSEGVLAEYANDIDEVIYTFVAAAPTYPFHVCEYRYDPMDLDDMEQAYRRLLDGIETCRESDNWEHPKTQQTNHVQFKTWS